jgi:glycosyltransferase involved in cell wall biosynthesis
MNFAPKVSVVTATYNPAGFLPETLDSVLQQKFQDFEVIVVDDGPTDHTKEALRPYEDRIRYVFQENRGPSAARNLEVNMARVPWIAIQDSDDVVPPII